MYYIKLSQRLNVIIDKSTYSRAQRVKQLNTYIIVNITCVTGPIPSEFYATNSAHQWGKMDLLTFVYENDNLGEITIFTIQIHFKKYSLKLTLHPRHGLKSLILLSQVLLSSIHLPGQVKPT